ncbi:hypothetical protein Tco_1228009 [Tanacetum coccineum]
MCAFTGRWSLDELAYGVPTDGPYQTNLPSPDDIISSIRIDRECQVCRIRHEEEIDVLEYQVLTREIKPTLKPLEEIIQENVFCLGGNRDHVPACLCYMLYCVIHSEKFNLAYFMAKRMEWVTKQKRVMDKEDVSSTSYTPPLIKQSSSHLNDYDDDEGNYEDHAASTPFPIQNTYSSFHSKLQISPPSSHEPTSPHHLNPLLGNIWDVPPRPLNPQPLQSHPSLDITLSLSPITPLDHIHDIPSPPSPPQPQPPIMGHPFF